MLFYVLKLRIIMKEKSNVPYSVINEGVLTSFSEDVPLWMVAFLMRVYHFNSRRNEKYALYMDKDCVKLRVSPDVLKKALDLLCESGDLTLDKVNSGLFLVQLSEKFIKDIDLMQ
mgnify:CR=1 FL=1